MNPCLVLQGIRTSINKKPYIFVIFQGGSRPPVPPLDPGMFMFPHKSNASLPLSGNLNQGTDGKVSSPPEPWVVAWPFGQ